MSEKKTSATYESREQSPPFKKRGAYPHVLDEHRTAKGLSAHLYLGPHGRLARERGARDIPGSPGPMDGADQAFRVMFVCSLRTNGYAMAAAMGWANLGTLSTVPAGRWGGQIWILTGVLGVPTGVLGVPTGVL